MFVYLKKILYLCIELKYNNMEITIRKSQSKYSDIIPTQIQNAKQYLRSIYPNVNLDNVDFIFGKGTRSRYFRNENNEKYSKPMCFISCSGTWHTYKKKTLKLTTPPHGIWLGVENKMLLVLIHELTHHIQYEENMNRGELETTRNEINYCNENFPEYYNKLKKI